MRSEDYLGYFKGQMEDLSQTIKLLFQISASQQVSMQKDDRNRILDPSLILPPSQWIKMLFQDALQEVLNMSRGKLLC